jgi:dienelactone hydrolase
MPSMRRLTGGRPPPMMHAMASTSADTGTLDGFTRRTFTFDGKTRDVFARGSGPAVIVIAEMPGITPKVVQFAERVADRGCTAVLPHLFGVPGRGYDNPVEAMAYLAASFVPVCVSREFVVLATGRTSPVVQWLRALARDEHERAGGPGVGVVGMCFTGGFALSMAADPCVVAPVLSQPSLPLPVLPFQACTLDVSRADFAAVKARCRDEDLPVVGLRFKGDRIVPKSRFDFLRRELGDAFLAVELDDSAANPASPMPPHSVLTEHLVDEEGEPTRAALDLVLDHLHDRLVGAGT